MRCACKLRIEKFMNIVRFLPKLLHIILNKEFVHSSYIMCIELGIVMEFRLTYDFESDVIKHLLMYFVHG